MRGIKTSLTVLAIATTLASCSHHKDKKEKASEDLTASLQEQISQESIAKHVADWPAPSKEASNYMISKYGLPTGVTNEALVWTNIGPFKKSVVHREAITHKFPMEHPDVLEHFINYKSPNSKQVSKVWDFDGSVVLERTTGTMSARCDKEGLNFLALNLANDVIQGKRSVEDARLEYGRQALALQNGQGGQYTQELAFTPAAEGSGDPDRSIEDKLMKDKKPMAGSSIGSSTETIEAEEADETEEIEESEDEMSEEMSEE